MTLHGEGSFGFPAVTETTGRRLPSEASPSGGRETKTRRKFSQGPGGPGARSSPWPAQWRRDGHGERAVTPKSSCYPGQDRLAKEGAMTHWATQGPRAPRGLLSHCTQEPSFWTPFPWLRNHQYTGGHSCILSNECKHCCVPALGWTVWYIWNCDREADIWGSGSRQAY